MLSPLLFVEDYSELGPIERELMLELDAREAELDLRSSMRVTKVA